MVKAPAFGIVGSERLCETGDRRVEHGGLDSLELALPNRVDAVAAANIEASSACEWSRHVEDDFLATVATLARFCGYRDNPALNRRVEASR